jgi:hypothetical protein
MANSDNQTVQSIKSKFRTNAINYTDLDPAIVALGLPDKVGTRFNHADWLKFATDNSMRLIKIHEMEAPVMVRKSTAKEFLSFSLGNTQVGTATIDSVNGTIAINVTADTVATALIATFLMSQFNQGAKIGSTAQVSGTTENDFSTPVTYVVKDEAGNTKNWVVTVTKLSKAALMTGFDLAAKT